MGYLLHVRPVIPPRRPAADSRGNCRANRSAPCAGCTNRVASSSVTTEGPVADLANTTPRPSQQATSELTLDGLTSAEATATLTAEGYNELPTAGRRHVLSIALDVVREPMFLLLLADGGI